MTVRLSNDQPVASASSWPSRKPPRMNASLIDILYDAEVLGSPSSIAVQDAEPTIKATQGTLVGRTASANLATAANPLFPADLAEYEDGDFVIIAGQTYRAEDCVRCNDCNEPFPSRDYLDHNGICEGCTYDRRMEPRRPRDEHFYQRDYIKCIGRTK